MYKNMKKKSKRKQKKIKTNEKMENLWVEK